MKKDIIMVSCFILEDIMYNDIVKTLVQNNLSLEDFDKELLSLVLNTTDSFMNKVSMLIDYYEYKGTPDGHPSLDFEKEIQNLILNLVYRINQVSVRYKRLIDIKFSGNNVMHLFYE